MEDTSVPKKQKVEEHKKHLPGLYTKSTSNWNIEINKTIDDLNLNITRDNIYVTKSDLNFKGDIQTLLDIVKDMDLVKLTNEIILSTNSRVRQILLKIRSINNTETHRIEAEVDILVYQLILSMLDEFVDKYKNILLEIKPKRNLTFPVKGLTKKGIADIYVTSIPDYIIQTTNDIICLITEDKDKHFLAFGQAIGECIASIINNLSTQKSMKFKSYMKDGFPFLIVSGTDFLFGKLYMTEDILNDIKDGIKPTNKLRVNINGTNDEQSIKDNALNKFIGLDFNKQGDRKQIINYLYNMIDNIMTNCQKYDL